MLLTLSSHNGVSLDLSYTLAPAAVIFFSLKMARFRAFYALFVLCSHLCRYYISNVRELLLTLCSLRACSHSHNPTKSAEVRASEVQ